MDFAEKLKDTTKKFAIDIVKFCQSLPKSSEASIIGNQLLRSATSVAANYRAACRARSKAEFIAKLGIVVEEADESVFWLEILIETKISDNQDAQLLLNEAEELMKITSSSRKTAKSNNTRL